MSQTTHTYGPTCHLAKSVPSSGSKSDDDIPDIKAQCFYYSPFDIDDPQAIAPTPTGSESKSTKVPPRPFSAYDNNTLEEAWSGLRSEKDRKIHNKGKPRKPSRPAQNDRTSSTVGTLGAKPGQKGQYAQAGAKSQPDPKASATPVSHQLSSRANKKSSCFSAHISSEQPLNTTCSCPGGHDACKSKSGQCDGGSCPNTSIDAKSLFSGTASATKKSDKAKETPNTPGTSSNEANALQGEVKKKFAADDQARPNDETKCNPFNSDCDDPDHRALDLPAPGCCSDFEGAKQAKLKSSPNAAEPDQRKDAKPKASPETTPASKGKDTKHKSSADATEPAKGKSARSRSRSSPDTAEPARGKDETPSPSPDGLLSDKGKGTEPAYVECELGECQGDAAHDRFAAKSGISKAQSSCESPPEDANCELSSKEHKELEKHETSKAHQAFTKHLQVKHVTAENSDVRIKRSKSSEQSAAPSPPSDLTNRLDQGNDAGTTGRPFLKLPSRPASPQPPRLVNASHESENPASSEDACNDPLRGNFRREDRDPSETETLADHKCKAHKSNKEHADVPVGYSRLHKVILPTLQMVPIYWSTIHDNARVIRATWFYRDTMYPVEPTVANQLEMGYRTMRAWSGTYKDELRSAMDAGAAGEEKIAHRLWPTNEDKHRTSDDIISTDPYCAARCFQGEAAAEGAADWDDSDKMSPDTKTIVKKYPNCQVIYKDSRTAFILKPNLQPSAYHKRRPLLKIKKGLSVGIPVCRGFDWKDWEKLHPSKKTNIGTEAEGQVAVSGDSNLGKRNECVACRSQEEQKECTDLILVCHGIGQKLSERMESFHFTHAMNSFRRSVNAELCNESVQKVLRDGLGGIMVLPVNWRSNLSLGDGDPLKDGDSGVSESNYTLEDITQTSIPAIRQVITDVMLDIPYYMSKYKPTMIQAVCTEANRVYRLWCKNNPNFCIKGRVHIIAHSLGSAMCMEILSKQPTHVPKPDFNGKKINTKYLDFNTTNLFCVGSPAAFFLHLEKATIKPRRGLKKPGAEMGDEKDKSIVDEQGSFGCLAVENLYNVMHINDPIAYRLNACADQKYAATLKHAQVPSATTGWFESLSNAVKNMTPGVTAPTELAVGQVAKPAIIARMPSQLEMEVHNFTAEEKAEKKLFLLNDNGQMDYCLSSPGGPLNLQYLNMLSAHSSYWTHLDFIRMLCVEVGRKPGKDNCLPNMKAVKIRHKS